MLRRAPAFYLVAVAAVAATRAVSGVPALHSFALTPDRLGHGKVWLLASSALIVNGPPLPQIVALVITLVVAERRLGATLTVAVMVVAHVGATLLAYAVLSLFTGDADGAHNRGLDYGTSAVWLGVLGALWAYSLPAARRQNAAAIAMVALGVAAVAVAVIAFPLLAAVEHGLAFALGAGVMALQTRASRSARSVAATAS